VTTNDPAAIARESIEQIMRDRVAAMAEVDAPPKRIELPDGTVIEDHSARMEATDRVIATVDQMGRALGIPGFIDDGDLMEDDTDA
jgi:hypothetical protein